MAYKIPTTQELFDSYLSRLESKLGQDSPINDKAFLRVLSAAMAGLSIGHYKYAADAVLQSLALTATGDDLDRIGLDNSCPRKLAEIAILEVDLIATTGTIIPANWEFVGDSNGMRYKIDAEVTAVLNLATLSLSCIESGDAGNLDVGETLSMSAPITGAETQGTVMSIIQSGVDNEIDQDYRPRVIFSERAITGGSNATDHKIWAEAVIGVKRAFPYSGKPGFATSYPGERTVFVEAITSIDADGLAPVDLINDVREAINTDPDTGLSRMVLGLTDATLYIYSIIRTPLFITISGLVVDTDKEADLKLDLTAGLDLCFRSLVPFVDGVDVVQERTDSVTSVSISQIVQDILFSYGASAETVTFGIVVGIGIPLYFLNPGELVKLGAIYYV